MSLSNLFSGAEAVRDFMYRERYNGLTTSDLGNMFENGSRREKKNASLYASQVAIDAYIDDNIGKNVMQNIADESEEVVQSYYNGDNLDNFDLELPDLDNTTRWTGLPGLEYFIERSVKDIGLNYDSDRVVAIASGGLEPGFLASEQLDAELDIIRYSVNDHRDDEVHDWNEKDYSGEEVLVIDDTSISGDTLNAAIEYVEGKGAEKVYGEVVSDKGSQTLRDINPF